LFTTSILVKLSIKYWNILFFKKWYIAYVSLLSIFILSYMLNYYRTNKRKRDLIIMKIYFANGLFALADRMFNEYVVEKIRKMDSNIEVYLPQENGDINDKMNYADSIKIAQEDNKELLSSDLVVAILDGDTMDDGVASEIGVAFGKEIPVIGVYTDL